MMFMSKLAKLFKKPEPSKDKFFVHEDRPYLFTHKICPVGSPDRRYNCDEAYIREDGDFTMRFDIESGRYVTILFKGRPIFLHDARDNPENDFFDHYEELKTMSPRILNAIASGMERFVLRGIPSYGFIVPGTLMYGVYEEDGIKHHALIQKPINYGNELDEVNSPTYNKFKAFNECFFYEEKTGYSLLNLKVQDNWTGHQHKDIPYNIRVESFVYTSRDYDSKVLRLKLSKDDQVKNLYLNIDGDNSECLFKVTDEEDFDSIDFFNTEEQYKYSHVINDFGWKIAYQSNMKLKDIAEGSVPFSKYYKFINDEVKRIMKEMSADVRLKNEVNEIEASKPF